MEGGAEEILECVEKLYHSSENSEKKLFGTFTRKKTVHGLEGIVNSELFSNRLWETNERLGRRGRIAPPSRKATVMIIGNHSAGKSSFINWYCDAEIQSTGIALETTHFTMVTKGNIDTTMRAEMATALYPMFKELLLEGNTEVFPGFLKNLETRISISKAKKFPFVDFIDTPGLSDGLIKYQCDMNVITWLAGFADLVFVFFDPVGQALCRKTLDLMKEIFRMHPNKVRFCLTKIDEIKTATEFNKLICQIALNLSQAIENQVSYVDILPICLPSRQYGPDRTQNRIKDLEMLIASAVEGKVQQNLGRLYSDLEFIDAHLAFLEREDAERRRFRSNLLLLRCTLLAGFIAIVTELSNAVVEVSSVWRLYICIALVLALVYTFYVKANAYSSRDRQQIAEWRKTVQAARVSHDEMAQALMHKFVS